MNQLDFSFKLVLQNAFLRQKIFQDVKSIHRQWKEPHTGSLVTPYSIKGKDGKHYYNNKHQKYFTWDQLLSNIKLLTTFGYWNQVIVYLERKEAKYSRYYQPLDKTTLDQDKQQQQQPFAVGLKSVIKGACQSNRLEVIDMIVKRYSGMKVPEVIYYVLFYSIMYNNQSVKDTLYNIVEDTMIDNNNNAINSSTDELTILESMIIKNLNEYRFYVQDYNSDGDTQLSLNFDSESDSSWTNSETDDEEYDDDDDNVSNDDVMIAKRKLKESLMNNDLDSLLQILGSNIANQISPTYIIETTKNEIEKLGLDLFKPLYHMKLRERLRPDDNLMVECILRQNHAIFWFLIEHLQDEKGWSTYPDGGWLNNLFDHLIACGQLEWLIKLLQVLNRNQEYHQPFPDSFITERGDNHDANLINILKNRISCLEAEMPSQFDTIRYLIDSNYDNPKFNSRIKELAFSDNDAFIFFYRFKNSTRLPEVVRYFSSKGLLDIKSKKHHLLLAYYEPKVLACTDHHLRYLNTRIDLDFIIELVDARHTINPNHYANACLSGLHSDLIRFFALNCGHTFVLEDANECASIIKYPHILEMLLTIHGRDMISNVIMKKFKKMKHREMGSKQSLKDKIIQLTKLDNSVKDGGSHDTGKDNDSRFKLFLYYLDFLFTKYKIPYTGGKVVESKSPGFFSKLFQSKKK